MPFEDVQVGITPAEYSDGIPMPKGLPCYEKGKNEEASLVAPQAEMDPSASQPSSGMLRTQASLNKPPSSFIINTSIMNFLLHS
jgi:hypothetical protein